MTKLCFGTNFTVFLLFFGIATLDAFQTRDWVRAALWFALALVFLYADTRERHA